MSDPGFINAGRLQIAVLKQLMETGQMPYDQAMLDEYEAQRVKFEDALEKERIAIENSRIATLELNRAADAYLNALCEDDTPPMTFPVSKKLLDKINRKKGN